MKIVDTNVLRVANGDTAQASPECVLACLSLLNQLRQQGGLVLDEDGEILNEYYRNARANGQPGVGDAFLHWCLLNFANPALCELVPITPHDQRGYEEFPDDPALATFDRSDRKFVAVALAHYSATGQMPTLHNATDSDWAHPPHYAAFRKHGLRLVFECPDYLSAPTAR